MARAWLPPSPRLLLLAALGAGTSHAYRSPDPSAIGADLLVRVGDACDMWAAWRLMGSPAFRNESLNRAGTGGVTPLMAATRAGCAELVALISLHPAFDGSAIRRLKQRKELADFASRTWAGKEIKVKWALRVVLGIRDSKVQQQELELDPRQALDDSVWFLPRRSEWMAPAKLDSMGVSFPLKPAFPERSMREVESSEISDLIVPGVLEKLWCLMVSYVQAWPGTEAKYVITHHVRSIGWSLFFHGGKDAMLRHQFCLALLVSGIGELPPDDDPRHDYLRLQGLNTSDCYGKIPAMVGTLWNKTGNWVLI